MTPQERELIADLFDKLAALERNPRDPQAEAAIREGLRDAPNAIYALVQTVMIQDEALKAANARIQQYEGGGAQPPQQERGFLDSMRDSIFGRDEQRGSVPRVPQGGAAPSGTRPEQRDPWGPAAAPSGYQQPPSYAQPAGYGQPQQTGGSSFLGTAAAAAAGVIGGSLLMNGIRSAFAGHQGGPAAGAFDHLGRNQGSPWGGAAGGDLSRDAGYGDVGGRSPFSQAQRDARQDAEQDAQDDADAAQDAEQDAADYDDGGDSDNDSDFA